MCEELQIEGELEGLLVNDDFDVGMRPKQNEFWAKLTLYL